MIKIRVPARKTSRVTTYQYEPVKKILTNQSASRLLAWVKKFRGIPILVVGDLMVDRAYRGPADRISPEAPVPVIHVQSESWTPGGAGNVVNNLFALGAKPSLISITGEDTSGDDVRSALDKMGVGVTGLVSDPSRPTITKTRVFAGHQQVARFDFERRGGISDSILKLLVAKIRQVMPQQKAVVISDYGKGVVTPLIIRTCIREAHRRGLPVVVDPKVEHFFQYRGVDCLTPNTKEAVEGMRSNPIKSEPELLKLGEKIMKKLAAKSLLITRGEQGMTLFDKGKKAQTISALAQEVYDVTGAGDTVISTFTLARAVGAPAPVAAQIANVAASLVVAKVGTVVATQKELIDRISDL